jgi:hypothetical protein
MPSLNPEVDTTSEHARTIPLALATPSAPTVEDSKSARRFIDN